MMTIRGVALWVCVAAALVGCCNHRYDQVTTRPGHQLKEKMFFGTWTLDAPRTNAANGRADNADLAPEWTQGVLGRAWRFEEDGVLKTEIAGAWKGGRWRIVDRDTLVVNEGNGEQQYAAHFDVGHLCLKKGDGTTLILRRVKAEE